MVTWGEQDMATIRSCQLQNWQIPQVWVATVMTPSHSAFVWPVLQLLLDPKANWVGGFLPLRDHHNKQIDQKTSSHRTNVQTTANGDSLVGFDITQKGSSWSTSEPLAFILHSQVSNICSRGKNQQQLIIKKGFLLKVVHSNSLTLWVAAIFCKFNKVDFVALSFQNVEFIPSLVFWHGS